MSSLKDKVVLITGAGGGIGRATARKLAKEGVRIAGCDLLEVRLTGLQEEMHRLGTECVAEPCDVTRLNHCERMVEKTLQRFGTIDVLINNAGVAHSGTVVESDPDLCETMVRVNLLGVYYMTRSVLTTMMEQESGHIVNMGSVAGIKYSPGYAIYSATKFAVRAFSEALRNEVQSHNIRVTLIQPGMTRTSLLYGFIPEGSPLPVEEENLLRPEDVAEAIFFALTCPERVALNELTLRSTWQER